MSNILRWTAGTLAASFTSIASGTELSSIGAGYGVMGGVAFDNSGASPDTHGVLSFTGTGTTPSSGVSNVAMLLYALNQDGSTYGPGDLTAGAAAVSLTPQLVPYECAIIGLPYGKTSATLVGNSGNEPFLIPPLKFYWALFNPLGNTITSAIVKFKSLVLTNNG